MFDLDPTVAIISSLDHALPSFIARLTNTSNTDSTTTKDEGEGADPIDRGRCAFKILGSEDSQAYHAKIQADLKEYGVDFAFTRSMKGCGEGVTLIVVSRNYIVIGRLWLILHVIKIEHGLEDYRVVVTTDPNHDKPPALDDFAVPDSLTKYWMATGVEVQLDALLSALSDFNPRPSILLSPAPAVVLPEFAYPFIHVLLVNEIKASFLTGIKFPEIVDIPLYKAQASRAIDWFISKGARHVVITLGPAGASFYDYTTQKKGHIDAFPTTKAITTEGPGAGEAFLGTFSTIFATIGLPPFDLENAVRVASCLVAWGIDHPRTWETNDRRRW